jgi:hypothetical protein
MRPAQITTTIIAALLVGACSSMQVESNLEPGASFDGLNTYSWAMLTDANGDVQMATNPLMRRRLIQAVDDQLAARGYTKVNEKGDFVVTFYSFSEQQIQWEQFDRTTRNLYASPIYINSWHQGTLVISALEPSGEKALWIGWASDALDPGNPGKGEKQINEAVTKIFAEFPTAVDAGGS